MKIDDDTTYNLVTLLIVAGFVAWLIIATLKS